MLGGLKKVFWDSLVALIVYIRWQHRFCNKMGSTCAGVSTKRWVFLRLRKSWVICHRQHTSTIRTSQNVSMQPPIRCRALRASNYFSISAADECFEPIQDRDTIMADQSGRLISVSSDLRSVGWILRPWCVAKELVLEGEIDVDATHSDARGTFLVPN